MSFLRSSLGIFFLLSARAKAVHTHQFEQFYPQNEELFSSIMVNNCSDIYQEYLHTPGTPLAAQYICGAVMNCVLSATTDSVKANMASANVVLGLLPTILALLGSTTPELSLLSSRRPLLAFLLSTGSPVVNPVRAFMFYDPITALKDGSRKATHHSRSRNTFIMLLQYVAVGGAVANVWTVSWQLGQKTIMNISCGIIYLEMLWVGLAAAVHLFGTLAFATRSKTSYPNERQARPRVNKTWSSMRAWAKRWPRNEFSLCETHTTHIFTWRKENDWFLVLSWWVSVLTVCHIIYATATFSSAIFIGMGDAWLVSARYMASVLVCRVVVAFELRGMRSGVKVVEEESEFEQEMVSYASNSSRMINVDVPIVEMASSQGLAGAEASGLVISKRVKGQGSG